MPTLTTPLPLSERNEALIDGIESAQHVAGGNLQLHVFRRFSKAVGDHTVEQRLSLTRPRVGSWPP